MTTTESELLRKEAARHHQDAADSFERCDTDGFLSQWASGITGRQKSLQADILDKGGLWEFWALFDLDGNLVPAKLLRTKYGLSWAIFETPEEATKRNGEIVRWVTAFPKRTSTLELKGYREGRVLAPARAEVVGSGTGLSGAASCSVAAVRTDGGYSPDVEIVDDGTNPREDQS